MGEILDSTAPGGKRFVFSDTGLRALRDDMAVRSLSAASPVKWEHVERLMQFSIGSYMRLSTAEVPILFADNIITGAVGTATAQGSAMAAAAAPVPGSSASEKQKVRSDSKHLMLIIHIHALSPR